jgi:hypothetical protein
MKIIRHREIEEGCTYSLVFDYVGEYNCGFSFPCDAQGNVDRLNPAAANNYAACVAGTVGGSTVQAPRIHRYDWTRAVPAVGKCVCGDHVELEHFTNTCGRCGRDYNSAGQELAPRSQWGEETGETAADILRLR